MNHLKMHSLNKIDENVSKIAQLFPNCVTEAKDENGEITHKIDFDMLKQELSTSIVEGREERYQFTWPDKKQAILTANAPINKTLRPCREESVNFDTTENLYIEGDNLEVLKLLQETYLGKIKMIYIDPPYNTGNDFVYEDDFAQNAEDYIANSGQYDEEGNRLVHNTESNGRFHTDWLNMMYPRLKLARDLLTDDGVIFISIDDCEYDKLKFQCNEIFGEQNFIATIVRNTNSSKNQSLFISVSHEYCLIYVKNIEILKDKHQEKKWSVQKNNIKEYLQKLKQMQEQGLTNEQITEELKILTKYPRFMDFTNYWYLDEVGLYRKDNIGGVKNGNMTPIKNHLTGEYDPVPPGGYRYNTEKLEEMISKNQIHFHTDGSLPTVKRYLKDYNEQRPKSIMSDDQRPDYSLMEEFNTPFDNPKQMSFMTRLISIMDKDSIVLDFFSGSATTAHAVMELNAEDNGNRKFIMIQIPEKCEEDSDAYKAGYKNICEIGKERIRKAGQKIKKEYGEKAKDVDIGFRVLKCDTSNMEDIYYTPDHFDKNNLFKDNVKADRKPEDLLFQSMLELGILPSCKIETKRIENKNVFFVNENYLVACFDENIDENIITQIAKEKPYYFVMRDSSYANDSVATNFDQIFVTYSNETIRKVI